MRGKQYGPDSTIKWSTVPDIQMRGGDGGPLSGRPLGQEYDGLESGELAWIMGRRYLTDDTSPDGGPAPFAALSASAHGLGMGFGVDRMQRLAYTSWMEAHFRAVFGNTAIALNNISLSEDKQTYMSQELKMYKPYLTGATVLGSVDVPHTANALFGAPVATLQYRGPVNKTVPLGLANPPPVSVANIRGGAPLSGLACGLFVAEKGPFLRGKVINDDAVDMIAPELSTPNGGNKVMHTVPRNLGDRLAFEALYSEMRSRNFFDWTPDGMVLSKLESPTGEPLSSAELDARQAQLFNVAIQGPAIAKTWTGDPKMQCMPLDKVFMVIVADVSSTVDDDGKTGVGSAAELAKAWNEYVELLRPTGGGVPTPGQKVIYDGAAAAAKAEFDTKKVTPKEPGDYATAVDELFTAQKNLGNANNTADKTAAEAAVNAARKKMDDFFAPLDSTFDATAAAIKQGTKGIAKSVMTNFKLMRVTSSYLAATSACVTTTIAGDKLEVDPKSRCGLPLGMKGAKTITGSYIIGGWCIGSVIDSAASRSSIGNMVRTAPASMAININVNVEWWSGDDLYKHYMDVDGTVFQRGVHATVKPGEVATREAKVDVGVADLEEFKSWQPFS